MGLLTTVTLPIEACQSGCDDKKWMAVLAVTPRSQLLQLAEFELDHSEPVPGLEFRRRDSKVIPTTVCR